VEKDVERDVEKIVENFCGKTREFFHKIFH